MTLATIFTEIINERIEEAIHEGDLTLYEVKEFKVEKIQFIERKPVFNNEQVMSKYEVTISHNFDSMGDNRTVLTICLYEGETEGHTSCFYKDSYTELPARI